MTAQAQMAPAPDRDLVLTRLIEVPPEKMGFHEGWARATDQLTELVTTL